MNDRHEMYLFQNMVYMDVKKTLDKNEMCIRDSFSSCGTKWALQSNIKVNSVCGKELAVTSQRHESFMQMCRCLARFTREVIYQIVTGLGGIL